MKPKTIILALVVAAAAGALTYSLTTSADGGVRNVDAAGAKAAIAEGAQVIDVRTPGEYRLRRIPGSVNVPLSEIAKQAPSWDRSKTYLVLCETGVRSLTAVSTLKSLGFTSIRNFAPGMAGWDGEIEQGEAQKSAQSVPTNGRPVMVEFRSDS